MRARDITNALTAVVRDGPPCILWGPPGVGKSDVADHTATILSADLLISHPVVDNPTDPKGFPWLTQDAAGNATAEFVPFGTLRRAMQADQLTIWFLDDLGQAVPAVQAAYMQLVLARRINGHVLPDCVRFLAASNRVEDRAGAGKLITPLLNRFCHLDFEVSMIDWQAWALSNGIDGSVRAFLNWKPEMLHKFDAKSGERSFPTPRAWSFVSRHVAKCPESVLLPVITGDVGEAAATMYVGFRRVWQNLPDLDQLIANPASMALPQQPDVVHAMIGGLVEKAKNLPTPSLDALGTIAGRIGDEHAALLVRDTMAVRPVECSSKHGCPNIQKWVAEHLELFAV